MRVALLRVGIDTAAGGIYGPLFDDATFVLMPIPEDRAECTYGRCTCTERQGGNRDLCWNSNVCLINYFPRRLPAIRHGQGCHCDPEFKTHTYGDLLRAKNRVGVRRLSTGDVLIFHCGLESWNANEGFRGQRALYLIGYFEVEFAGTIQELDGRGIDWQDVFASNAHVRDQAVLAKDRAELILVKGSSNSRLLTRAQQISAMAQAGIPMPPQTLLPAMREHFGDLGGQNIVSRGLRWIPPDHVEQAAEFVRGLP